MAALLAGCRTAPLPPAPVPFSAENGAATITARSLQDDGLRRFLRENLGREPGAWDFDALAWAAFYFHPSLGVARAQWQAARAAERTAAARPNPTISLVPGYNSTRTPGVSPWFPSLGLDFLLPTTAKRTQQAAIARNEAESARLAVVATVWLVRSELRRALADAAVAARRQSLLAEQVTVQQELLALIQQRLDAGSATSADLIPARTALLKARAAADDAQAQRAGALARVAGALGVSLAALEGVALPVPPALPVMTADALAAARRAALQSRADVLAALAHYQSTHATLEWEAAKQQPDFHLGPGYQWDQGANKWSLALSFELPLFHRNEGPLAEAVARRAVAAAQFTAAQAQALAALDAAVTAQSVAAALVANARAQRAESEQQLVVTRQRFDLGGADRVAVQAARLEVAGADLAVFVAEAAAALAAGQLEDALQIPFPNLVVLANPDSRMP
jgi:outer membrane protein TolC